jgi:uncharacterized protein YmfQ (DUF2313 family)
MPPPADAYEPDTLARLRDAALSLLPPGRSFTRRLNSDMARVCEALVVELARVYLEAVALYESISPRNARREDYLSAWEDAVDSPSTGTPAERAQHVADVIKGVGLGWAMPDFEAAAAALGFTITGPAETLPQFAVGLQAIGAPVRGDAFCYALIFPVVGPADALDALETALNAINRAHTWIFVRHEGANDQVIDSLTNTVVDSFGNRVVV